MRGRGVFGPFKMPVENESWGPAEGEIQRRNTSGLEERGKNWAEKRAVAAFTYNSKGFACMCLDYEISGTYMRIRY